VPFVCVCCQWRSRWSSGDIWCLRSLVGPSHVSGEVPAVGTILLVCWLRHWAVHLEGFVLWVFCRLGDLEFTGGWILPGTVGDS
jgi:hypothetical protein